MTLWVARHAPVEAVGICYGRYDLATRQEPETAASAILESLGEQGAQVKAVWSSGAQRCRLPAGELASLLGVPAHHSDDLQELDFGVWEGQPWDRLGREDGERLKRWMDGWQTEAPPEGETVGELERRVRGWLAKCEPGQLVVAHGGVIRALQVILRGLSWEDAMAREIEHLKVEGFPGPGPP